MDAAPPPMIWLYDLTHTLKHDLSTADGAARAWDEAHAVATIQGIVNRDAPRLYVRFVEWAGRNVDDWWLDQLSQPGEWLAGVKQRRRLESLEELVGHFQDHLRGAVVYDGEIPATSNLASTLAGVDDLVAIRYDPRPGSVYARLVERGPRLDVVHRLVGDEARRLFAAADGERARRSVKAAAYAWLRKELIERGKCNPSYLGYYIDAYWLRAAARGPANHHTLTDHDFFVSKRAAFCDLNCWGDELPVDDPRQPPGADLAALKDLLAALHKHSRGAILHIGGFTPWAYKYTDQPGAGGKHGGVDTEWELVRVVSAYNGFIDADAIGLGAMANASFFQHYPLKQRYEQARPPSDAELEQRGHARGADRDYVMFYVGDWDSAAWLYQRVPDLWDDPRRGEAPLSWAISPALAERAPMALAHLWRTRKADDVFIAGDNGAGYLNPSMLDAPRPISELPSGVAAWADHCERHYRRWDLRISGFVIDGHAPAMSAAVLDAYARFSPDGVVPQKTAAPALLHRGMPILRSGPDITEEDPLAAGATLARHVAERRAAGQRFHWFRTILKSPGWHADAVAELRRRDPRVEVVNAQVFFALLRRELERR